MEKPFPNTPEDTSRFFTFTWLAMFLALVTGIEIVIIYIPLSYWVIVGSLVFLSAIKFFAVIWWFMHLRWDRLFCTILFMLGLIIAGGTVTALLAIFHFDPHEPTFEDDLMQAPRVESLEVKV